MKKNITINLFGQLYAIDEDAVKLLEEYLENMKRYFSRQDGGDEIADDIEHRVAELFAEMKANGVEAISIEPVSLTTPSNTITSGGIWALLFILVIPAALLIFGFVRWMRRRKL